MTPCQAANKCLTCPETHCPTIASASKESMNRVLNGEITADESIAEMARLFPGKRFPDKQTHVEPF